MPDRVTLDVASGALARFGEGGARTSTFRVFLAREETWTAMVRPLAGLLDSVERGRVDRRASDASRVRAVLSLGLRRALLGQWLGVPGAELRFVFGEHGKPEIEGGGPGFSVSHTEGLLALAIGERGAIGIDIERERSLMRAPGIARRALHARVAESIAAMPEGARRDRAFLREWVRHEAQVKALGQSAFSGPYDLPAVALEDILPGYVGALAVGSGRVPEFEVVEVVPA